MTPIPITFDGAVKGQPEGMVKLQIRPKGAKRWQEHKVFVKRKWSDTEKKAFGDMILGVAAGVGLGVSISLDKDIHVVEFRKFGVTYRIPAGEEMLTATVASVEVTKL